MSSEDDKMKLHYMQLITNRNRWIECGKTVHSEVRENLWSIVSNYTKKLQMAK